MTTKYETIVVFKSDLNETQIKEEEKKIEGVLKTEGAQSVSVEAWGRKEIAYVVRKSKTGNFVCFKYQSDKSDTVKNVTNILRITDSVIKFQTHKEIEKIRKFKGNPRRPATSEGDDFYDGVEDAY